MTPWERSRYRKQRKRCFWLPPDSIPYALKPKDCLRRTDAWRPPAVSKLNPITLPPCDVLKDPYHMLCMLCAVMVSRAFTAREIVDEELDRLYRAIREARRRPPGTLERPRTFVRLKPQDATTEPGRREDAHGRPIRKSPPRLPKLHRREGSGEDRGEPTP